MKRFKPWHAVLGAALAIVVALLIWRLTSSQVSDADTPVGKALVTVAPIESGAIEETVTAFGTVAAAPGTSHTIAAPRGVIVERVLVSPGQAIAAGAPLITLSNTPATEQTVRQASDALTFAQRDLERVQRLYNARLAAGDQLDAATKALADARATAAAQSQAGAGAGRQTIASPVSGLVASIVVSAGDHVAADSPLLSLAPRNGLAATLSVEPEKAARLAPGQAVQITSTFDPGQSALGHVARIGHLVDPTTHMIGVTVPLDAAGFALGSSLQGQITVASHPGLRSPRAAVVYDEQGAHVFVVREGKAHLVQVTPGAESGSAIEIKGDVRAGDMVAVSGAYQLEDGWPVRTASK